MINVVAPDHRVLQIRRELVPSALPFRVCQIELDHFFGAQADGQGAVRTIYARAHQ